MKAPAEPVRFATRSEAAAQLATREALTSDGAKRDLRTEGSRADILRSEDSRAEATPLAPPNMENERFDVTLQIARADTPRSRGLTIEREPLDAALEIARAGLGVTLIAFRAPLVAPSAFARAWPEAPMVAWSAPANGATPALTIAGIGVARELRGVGPDRWAQLVTAARGVTVHGAVRCSRSGEAINASAIDADDRDRDLVGSRVRRYWRPSDIDAAQGSDAASSTLLSPGALGLARPRFVGGAAFAAGAAERGPWTGFGDAWFVLPRWTYTSDGETAWLVLAVDELEANDAARWHAELAIHEAMFASRPVLDAPPTALEIVRASTELWRAQVEAITAAIGNGECSKIVAARTCAIALAPSDANGSSVGGASDAIGVRAAALLDALDARHGECVRLLVRPPNAGALVAATPERLVRRDAGVIRCDALAGTIRHGGEGGERAATALLASAKDRREHELVVRAIREALEELGARVEAPAEPQIRTLRHVLHLHTPFRGTTANPPHVLELAARLHPTPAVGGTPTQFAIDWIREHEPVPRGWYASPVGWFDLEGDGELAVAIRSGVVAGDRVHLWAGAGIVAGSDPDRELAETELKLRAMLGALGVG